MQLFHNVHLLFSESGCKTVYSHLEWYPDSFFLLLVKWPWKDLQQHSLLIQLWDSTFYCQSLDRSLFIVSDNYFFKFKLIASFLFLFCCYTNKCSGLQDCFINCQFVSLGTNWQCQLNSQRTRVSYLTDGYSDYWCPITLILKQIIVKNYVIEHIQYCCLILKFQFLLSLGVY